MTFFLIITGLVLFGIFYFSRSRTKQPEEHAYLQKSNTKSQTNEKPNLTGVIDTVPQFQESLKEDKSVFVFGYLIRQWSTSEWVGESGDFIYLKPQPTNTRDKNAVAAYVKDGFIGYIAKEENKELTKYLQKCKTYFAFIDWASNDKPRRYKIVLFSSEWIGSYRDVIRDPDNDRYHIDLRKKYKLKRGLSDKDREDVLELVEDWQFDLVDERGKLFDHLFELFDDLASHFTDEPESDEEEFDGILFALKQTDFLLKSDLVLTNKKVTVKLKDKLYHLLELMS